MSQGVLLNDEKIIICCENDININPGHEEPAVITKDTYNDLLDLHKIKTNDYIIHADYGIGQYLGLCKLNVDDNEEFIKLIYANNDQIYIPISDLENIYPYRSEVTPDLAKLGSKKWQNSKKKAISKMVDSASELLEIYSKRINSKKNKYRRIDKNYANFAAEFPFTETPDQEKAIAAVIDDLHSDKLTDRLICGDVGFGKTEIIMRAAFLAVSSKLQVVVIAPTTLLANQHFETFKERMVNWPINILSLIHI